MGNGSESGSDSEEETWTDVDFREVGEGAGQMQLENSGLKAEIGEDHPMSPLLNRAQQTEVETSQKSNQRIEVVSFGGMAGKPIRMDGLTSTKRYQAEVGQDSMANNLYAPFSSQTDWEFAKWAKLRGPTSTAVTDLLSIPNVSLPGCSGHNYASTLDIGFQEPWIVIQKFQGT